MRAHIVHTPWPARFCGLIDGAVWLQRRLDGAELVHQLMRPTGAAVSTLAVDAAGTVTARELPPCNRVLRLGDRLLALVGAEMWGEGHSSYGQNHRLAFDVAVHAIEPSGPAQRFVGPGATLLDGRHLLLAVGEAKNGSSLASRYQWVDLATGVVRWEGDASPRPLIAGEWAVLVDADANRLTGFALSGGGAPWTLAPPAGLHITCAAFHDGALSVIAITEARERLLLEVDPSNGAIGKTVGLESEELLSSPMSTPEGLVVLTLEGPRRVVGSRLVAWAEPPVGHFRFGSLGGVTAMLEPEVRRLQWRDASGRVRRLVVPEAVSGLDLVSAGDETYIVASSERELVVLPGSLAADETGTSLPRFVVSGEPLSTRSDTVRLSSWHGQAEPQSRAGAALVDTLAAHGLLGELKPAARTSLVEQVFKARELVHEADTALVLAAHWGTARGLVAGFLSHDWRFGQETDDVIDEFARAIADPAIALRQVRKRSGELVASATFAGDETRLVWDFAEDSLDDVASSIDAWLGRIGAQRRIFGLKTHGDWFAYLIVTPHQLAALRAAGVPGLPGSAPTLRPHAAP
jgi:hypothetical protein